ncbi:UDP-N-acetylmuramate--L-alanine ligase [Spirosoma montaniterrae]|uniref:Peptidoglycan synthetase n=1 Tax=Spirosoma montaniterrae TaxID=1178516 RepID=A0A1P9X1E7_9BACT|nr:Mur ligase family protein [Spirosoma montaniterrae]AQG81454.1 peptidoglycan synthetase [Spirosoma montaniterrae]
MPQAIHFISIGGSAMHNLALSLHHQGYQITGSDDEIYEPSRSRLAQHGLLPAEMGWFPEKISHHLSAVIVGMHARSDNPELARAQELDLPIFSYPEFIYQQSKQKQRVVIAGSHGKTTITSMILHVLKYHNRKFDYLVGAQLDGFETMAQLTPDAPIIIIEGDEYASSPIDPRPKFLHYHPHIALISGIAWDHVNIYPTWDQYVDQFELLAEAMPKAGILVFDETDDMLDVIGQKEREDIVKLPYEAHPSDIVDGQTLLITKKGEKIPVLVFGEHNMKNIAGAMTVLDRIGITDDQFYAAIPTFKGAARRLEKIAERGNRILFRDFAHAPSKVEATTEAVKRQYPDRKLLAVVELHTYSSLNKNFLSQYKNCLDAAEEAVVYFNAHTLAVKQLEPITAEDILTAFDRANLRVFTDSDALADYLSQQRDAADVFLLMSSGTFGNLSNDKLIKQLL